MKSVGTFCRLISLSVISAGIRLVIGVGRIGSEDLMDHLIDSPSLLIIN